MKQCLLLSAIWCVTFLGLTATQSIAQSGELDPTFGTNGFLLPNFIPDMAEYPLDLLVLPNDQFIIGGYVNGPDAFDLMFVRFNPDGSLDPTFGVGGISTFNLLDDPSSDKATSLELLPDGKILVSGSVYQNSVTNAYIMRLLPDGSIDTSFGESGQGYTLLNAGSGSFAHGVDLEVIGGQSILVGARVSNGEDRDFCVFRLTQGGGIDQSFGSNGATMIDLGGMEDLTNMDVDLQGRIVLGGTSYNVDSYGAIVRLSSFGTPDNTFNGSGVITFWEGPGQNVVGDVLCDEEGRIYAAGSVGEAPDKNAFIFRYLNDGSLDPDFSDNGQLFSDVGTANGVYLYDLFPMPGNRILATGHLLGQTLHSAYALMVNEDGNAVTDFSGGGDVDHPLPAGNPDYLHGLCNGVLSDGTILLGGIFESSDFDVFNLYLAKVFNLNYTSVHEATPLPAGFPIYPNPAINEVNFDLDPSEKITSVNLIDLRGRICRRWFGNERVFMLDPTLPAGSYLLHIITENNMYISRLIIQR